MTTPELLVLVKELRGTFCRCGKPKLSRQTFCRGCYSSLSTDRKKALYRRVGNGYEEAYAAAVEELKHT